MSTNVHSDVHQTLRRATTAAHHALDHHPLLRQLTGGGLTRELYAESLAAMYRPHVRLERRVHESSHHADSGLRLAARQELLEADLSQLGCPAPEVSHIPRDPLEARAAWLGWVYVLEGSRLGGRVIARRIHSILGDAVPSRFFGAVLVPDERNAVLAMCERELVGRGGLEQAVAGARAAFAAYKDDLDAYVCAEHDVAMSGGA